MFNRVILLEIVSGQRRGMIARLVRTLLSCVTPLYRFAISWRNRKFDAAASRAEGSPIQSVSVPVVSVGNLTTGGTGKTPVVIWLARRFQETGKQVAILSRGYGSNDQLSGQNDEAIEIEFHLPTVPHLQNRNRSQIASESIERFGAEVILLDDGFQHRQLHRNLDIVLIDCLNPFGYGRLLPRGLLREPVCNLNRAQVVILTRCNQIGESELNTLEQQIRQQHPHLLIAKSQMVPTGWLRADGQEFPLQHLQAEPLFSFCGIGNPAGFTKTLSSVGLNPIRCHHFPDHHLYSAMDLDRLGQQAIAAGAQAIVCTHKDLVKIESNRLSDLPLYALKIQLEFLSGQQELETVLVKIGLE